MTWRNWERIRNWKKDKTPQAYVQPKGTGYVSCESLDPEDDAMWAHINIQISNKGYKKIEEFIGRLGMYGGSTIYGNDMEKIRQVLYSRVDQAIEHLKKHPDSLGTCY